MSIHQHSICHIQEMIGQKGLLEMHGQKETGSPQDGMTIDTGMFKVDSGFTVCADNNLQLVIPNIIKENGFSVDHMAQ